MITLTLLLVVTVEGVVEEVVVVIAQLCVPVVPNFYNFLSWLKCPSIIF